MSKPDLPSSRVRIPSKKKRENDEDDTAQVTGSATKRLSTARMPCPFCFTTGPWKNAADLVRLHCKFDPVCKTKLSYCDGCHNPFLNERALNCHINQSKGCKHVRGRSVSERHSTSNIPLDVANVGQFYVNPAVANYSGNPGQRPSIASKDNVDKSYFINVSRTANAAVPYPFLGLSGVLSNSQSIRGDCSSNDIHNDKDDVSNPFNPATPDNTSHHGNGQDNDEHFNLDSLDNNNHYDSGEDNDDGSNNSNLTSGSLGNDKNSDDDSSDSSEVNSSDDSSNTSNDPEVLLEFPQYDSDQLSRLRMDISEHRRGLCMEKEITSSLELSALLEKANAPLYLMKDIIAWATRNRENLPTYNEPITRETLLKKVSGKLYSEQQQTIMKPQVTDLTMPSGRKTSITTFDIIGCLCQLLTDTNLMNWSNLIYDGNEDNPFDLPGMNDLDAPYGEIETGDWYKETFLELITDEVNEILVPLVFFIDGTKISEYGTLSMEPVTMIPMIFNLETRNKAEASRVIGYLPNLDNMHGTKLLNSNEKAQDYHHALAHVMNGVRGLQNCGGMDWTFTSREGRQHKKRLVFTSQYIIGDCKGNDTLCGRYGTHAHTGGLVRDCDILTVDGDSTLHRCRFRQHNEVKAYSPEALKAASLRMIPNNAFNHITFGASKYGIYGSTPPEPLHVYKLGICARLPTTFFDRISTQTYKKLDIAVAYISTNFGRQSDRDFPSLGPFRDGLSSTPKLTADERYARCFAIYLALSTTDFSIQMIGSTARQTKSKCKVTSKNHKPDIISREEYQSWLTIFEETLSFYQWIILKRHPKKYFVGGWDSIAAARCRQFMETYKVIAQRHSGMGLKLTKFHQLSHWWFYITQFGSIRNVDGGCHESNAKVNTKSCARVTQLRAKSLNYQTGVRHYEKYLLEEASRLYQGDTSVERPILPRTENWVATGSKFLMTFIYRDEEGFVLPYPDCQCMVRITWTFNRSSQSTPILDPLVLSCVTRKLAFYNSGKVGQRLKSIGGFTEFKTDDVIVRAHPSYRSGLSWHDWVEIKWPEFETSLVANVLLMLDFSTSTYQISPTHCVQGVLSLDFTNTTKLEDDSEICAVVHSVMNADDTSPYYLKSNLLSRMSMENEFQLVSARSFATNAYVVIDELDENTGLPKTVISFNNMTSWASYFLAYLN